VFCLKMNFLLEEPYGPLWPWFFVFISVLCILIVYYAAVLSLSLNPRRGGVFPSFVVRNFQSPSVFILLFCIYRLLNFIYFSVMYWHVFYCTDYCENLINLFRKIKWNSECALKIWNSTDMYILQCRTSWYKLLYALGLDKLHFLVGLKL